VLNLARITLLEKLLPRALTRSPLFLTNHAAIRSNKK